MTPITTYIEIKKDFPDDSGLPILPGEMHVYHKDGIPCAINFHCPCGCGRECYTRVTVGEKKEHHWLFSKGPTIDPSIRYLSGCKWHFNITNGKVIVHADSGK